MWLFTGMLTLLPLWPSAAAPPLEGTLRLWAYVNSCPKDIVYSFATHKPLGPLVQVNNDLNPLACIIWLTTNGKWAFAALGYGLDHAPGTNHLPPFDSENGDLGILKGVQVAGKLMFFPYGKTLAVGLAGCLAFVCVASHHFVGSTEKGLREPRLHALCLDQVREALKNRIRLSKLGP